MKKLIFILFVIASKDAISQYMNPKCKPGFDTEIMMQVYMELDVYPEIINEKFTLFEFVENNFRIPAKDYGDKLRIKF